VNDYRFNLTTSLQKLLKHNTKKIGNLSHGFHKYLRNYPLKIIQNKQTYSFDLLDAKQWMDQTPRLLCETNQIRVQ